MCNSVTFEGRTYNTPRELSKLVGGMDQLIWTETSPFRNLPAERDWRDPDLCLCAIELEQTLEQAGFRWRRGYDPMEYFAARDD